MWLTWLIYVNGKGAFTPSCSVRHLPGYIEKLKEIREKGVDVVAVLAFNDAWVMSAWGKANGIKGDDIVCHHHCLAPPCRRERIEMADDDDSCS